VRNRRFAVREDTGATAFGENETRLRSVAADCNEDTDGGAAMTERGTGSALDIRARVKVTPWTDADFEGAVRQVLQEVRLVPEIVFGSGEGAVLAQRLLRERGYEHARVIDMRSVDEAIRHIAHWEVLRDE
jgi:hypothetical protein